MRSKHNSILYRCMSRVLSALYNNLLCTVGVATTNHKLRRSASPVLTATHHSYGRPRLSDFFPAHLLGSDPPTDLHAKWLKRRVFTQGCIFCSKNRYFSYTLISIALKRSKVGKCLELEIFLLDFAFNIRGHRKNTPYSSSEPNESGIVNRQSGGEKLTYLNFT